MMGWFGKKNKQEDAIAKADKMMNKGLTGMMMKGFVSKEHREAINQSLDSAKQAQWAASGSLPLTATATVVTITDTGRLINFDPIVVLVLDVTRRTVTSISEHWKHWCPKCRFRELAIGWDWARIHRIRPN